MDMNHIKEDMMFLVKNSGQISEQEYNLRIDKGFFANMKLKKFLKQNPSAENSLTAQFVEMMEKYQLKIFFHRLQEDIGKVCMDTFDSNAEFPTVLPEIPQTKEPEELLEEFLTEERLNSVLEAVNEEDRDELKDYLLRTESSFRIKKRLFGSYLQCVEKLAGEMPTIPYDDADQMIVLLIDHLVDHGKKYFPAQFRAYQERFSPVVENIGYSYRDFRRIQNRFYKDMRRTICMDRAVKKVHKIFKNYPGKIRILQNARFKADGKWIKCDFLIVTAEGIFPVDIKSLGSTGGYNVVVESNGSWKKVQNGGRWKSMGFTGRKSLRRILGLEKILLSGMETPTEHAIPMHEFTVLTGEVLKLTNKSDRVIVRTSEIQQIMQILPKKLSDEQIDRIADIFEQAASGEKREWKTKNWVYTYLAAHQMFGEKLKAAEPVCAFNERILADYGDINPAFAKQWESHNKVERVEMHLEDDSDTFCEARETIERRKLNEEKQRLMAQRKRLEELKQWEEIEKQNELEQQAYFEWMQEQEEAEARWRRFTGLD